MTISQIFRDNYKNGLRTLLSCQDTFYVSTKIIFYNIK